MKDSDYVDLIAEAIECESDMISGRENLADLPRWDSMAVVAFIAACDNRLGAVPSAQEVTRCKTVADLIALARSKTTS